MSNNLMIPTITCRITQAKFRFEDHMQYQKWKRDKEVTFIFDALGSQDEGVSVFEDTADSGRSCAYEAAWGPANVSIQNGEFGPEITGDFDILLPPQWQLDEASLANWVENLGGRDTATIQIGDHATLESVRGIEFQLVRIPVGPSPTIDGDEIPF